MLMPTEPLNPSALVRDLWSPEVVPDYRLYRRMEKIVRMILERLDDAASVINRAARRGAQRFWNNSAIVATTLASAATARMASTLLTLTFIVVAHDTTECDEHGANEPSDAGPLRSSHARGYLVHSAAVIDPTGHTLLGILTSHAWKRPWKLHKQDHKDRAPAKKESAKWKAGIQRSTKALKEAGVTATVVNVIDREGDIHENFAYAIQRKLLVVVRAAQDRNIVEGNGTLWNHLSAQPPVGEPWSVSVRAEVKKIPKKKKNKKEPCDQPAIGAATLAPHPVNASNAAASAPASVQPTLPRMREARLVLRYGSVTLKPPMKHKSRRPIKLNAIYVCELDPPVGLEPVDWMLLCNCAVTTEAEARAVVAWYQARWGIEDFHKILKLGCHLEKERVDDIESFRRLLAVLVPIASHIARWTHAARRTPKELAANHVTPTLMTSLKDACRYHHLPLPRRAWTIGDLIDRLARLGGYEPRHDRLPGWLVIWRGWRELERLTAAFAFARSTRNLAPD